MGYLGLDVLVMLDKDCELSLVPERPRKLEFEDVRGTLGG